MHQFSILNWCWHQPDVKFIKRKVHANLHAQILKRKNEKKKPKTTTLVLGTFFHFPIFHQYAGIVSVSYRYQDINMIMILINSSSCDRTQRLAAAACLLIVVVQV